VIDELVCPFCGNDLVIKAVYYAIFDKYNQYDGKALRRFWCCFRCELYFVDKQMQDHMIRVLKPYHAQFMNCKFLNPSINSDQCRKIMYTTITQPVPKNLIAKYNEKIAKEKEMNDLLVKQKEELKNSVQEENLRLRKEHEENIRNWQIRKYYNESGKIADFTRRGKSGSIKVMYNTCHCKSCEMKYGGSTIINKTAKVETLKGNIIEIDVQACFCCGSYYMDYISLLTYESKFGRLLLERYDEEDGAESWEEDHDYQRDTILSRCGYRAQEHDLRIERWAVIDYILDSGKAEKYQLKEILSRFISGRGNRCHMAVKKWQEDLEHINNYRIDEQEVVSGLTLIKNPRK